MVKILVRHTIYVIHIHDPISDHFHHYTHVNCVCEVSWTVGLEVYVFFSPPPLITSEENKTHLLATNCVSFVLSCPVNIQQTFSSPLHSHQLHSLLVLQGIVGTLKEGGGLVGCCSVTDRCQGTSRANQHLVSLSTRTVLQ